MEIKLACTLEELYKGAQRLIRVLLDESGQLMLFEEVLAIDIKPGWKKGTKITFSEKGRHECGYAPGDLTVVVDEEPHSTFKRDGNDLVVHQTISLLDPLTGNKILNIKSLDDRVLTIHVSYNVEPGQEIVIRNEGMPISKEPGKNGNLRISWISSFHRGLPLINKLSDLTRVFGKVT